MSSMVESLKSMLLELALVVPLKDEERTGGTGAADIGQGEAMPLPFPPYITATILGG